MAERVNKASATYAYGEDEFDQTGFTRVPLHATWVIGEVLARPGAPDP